MKSPPFIFLLFIVVLLRASAQEQLTVSSFGPTPDQWLLLAEDRQVIADNDSLNEELVDLVQAFSVDSVMPSKSQRHRVGEAGWIISIFGYKWKALNPVKQKFVGTETHGIRVPGLPAKFTEYDVNFNLVPHIRKYIDLVWVGYEQQAKKNRWNRIKDLTTAPWVYPETLENINRYAMHCELTPPESARAMLNEKFYPCIRPNSSREHHNIGSDKATYGLYGPFVADYNHAGHPEIHPYDWIWWYDTHPDRLQEESQTWFFGFMKESSNRFRGWYRKREPIVGQISVPFVFNLKKETLRVMLEHLVHDHFEKSALKQHVGIPNEAMDAYFSNREFTFSSPELMGKRILFSTSNPIRQEGLKMWFSDLNHDTDRNLLSGYLNLAVSVGELYNAKLSFQ